jgi:xanthine/uracil/vitamin C permease (AzgA family)
MTDTQPPNPDPRHGIAACLSAFGTILLAVMAIATFVVHQTALGLVFVPGCLWFLWLTIGKWRAWLNHD